MDSLLSNAQRCARKADTLLSYGLYDESLTQLEKSIAYLNELKSVTTCYESIQLLNAQLESIDRKMRSVAIKRSESIKKKNEIESLISKNRRESSSSTKSSKNSTGYLKLEKDGRSVLEELSTTNAEYKKVNSFLIDEIEQLKRENEFLKSELLKISSSSASSSVHSSQNSLRSSSSSLMITSPAATAAAAVHTATSMITSSGSLSTGVVPVQQPQKSLMVATPITTVIDPHDDEDENEHDCMSVNKQPPIDLSRYINEEDDEEDESGYNECSNCSGVYSSDHSSSFLVDTSSSTPNKSATKQSSAAASPNNSSSHSHH